MIMLWLHLILDLQCETKVFSKPQVTVEKSAKYQVHRSMTARSFSLSLGIEVYLPEKINKGKVLSLGIQLYIFTKRFHFNKLLKH